MAFVGVIQSTHFFGATNGSLTTSSTHNFGPSSIWSYPLLQSFDEDGTGSGVIDSFVDNTGFHSLSGQLGGGFVGLFRNNCTQVHFFFAAQDSIHTASAVTIFFG